jgi:hypothetical protein
MIRVKSVTGSPYLLVRLFLNLLIHQSKYLLLSNSRSMNVLSQIGCFPVSVIYTPPTLPSFHSTPPPNSRVEHPPWSITGYADCSVGFDSGRYVSNLTADANRK